MGASSSRQVRDIDMIRDIDWASGDCGETNDSADPRTASLSRSHDVLVVGDSWAKVKLYSSPACQPRSLNHSYTGHSSQISSLSWSFDGNKLLSSGGKDTAVLQWGLQM